ncbi:sperm flagellar protein 2 isoform X2 [Melanotaenia boesemani]|uniref:sperm flagellar protein 2 isoform X2 n=1 Tax=Melanotaenia boesemani TaxID=1250792 RepID=UPI001C03AE2F|nr:sperm flagellar protein 2 isoform X2 [Melanotaenia boesemani]
MSDILCRWLNEEVRLSKAVDPGTFAKDFSNGYLIGEILHTYQMQDDFNLFFKRDNSVAKLNNFTRLDPTLKLLGIPFDINTAQDLMQEKDDVAKRILYQLYVALEQKKKSNISRTMMEIMQPAARANLHKKDHEMFSYRLPQVVKRDADVKLQKISQHYADKYQPLNDRYLVTQSIQGKRQLKILDKKRIETIEKVSHEQQNDMTCNLATEVQMQKPSFYAVPLDMRRKQQQHSQQKARKVQTEIAQFKTNREKLSTSKLASSSNVQPLAAGFPLGGSKLTCEVSGSIPKLMLQSNSTGQEIQRRLRENAVACEQREKRLDRFLVEQFKAHEAQQELQADELLVKRLTRQTKQEQRLAAQLMIIRRQKEVILENRLFRELQYQQRREKDLQEALYKEAVLAQQAKLAFEEEIRKELEFCDRPAAERAQSRHKEHFVSCKNIVEQIVDLATKAGEYCLLTEKDQIPEKQMRQWKELLLRGLPLYESISHQSRNEFSISLDPKDLEKQEILNKLEYDEYASMVDEWGCLKETGETKLLSTPNNILGHVIQRLKKIVRPPIIESPSHLFPHCTIKACVLGKLCSGKTTCLAKISEALGICVLSADTVIEEALQAYKNADDTTQVTEHLREKDNEQLTTSPASGKRELNIQVKTKDLNTKIAVAHEEMRKGNTFSNELLVDILVEAISQVPAQSGWILDGFPYDINLAHLLEEALGGSVDDGNEVESNRTSLPTDPYSRQTPPPPAPVLDLALLLNIPDDCAVRRAYRHSDTEAAATDKTLYRGQISNRIITFQDTWPALKQWFGEKQNILVSIDADVDEVGLYSRVESILKQVMLEKQTALSDPPVEDVVLYDTSATTPSVDQPPALIDQGLGTADSLFSIKKENVLKPSDDALPASAPNEDSQGVLENHLESTLSDQDSSSQVYVDEPIPLEIAESLCSHWDTVCDSYVNDVKKVLQLLRLQHAATDNQLFNIRERSKQFLGRPDLKQELVSHWQKYFNSVCDDMRREEETKADLHHRLDELCERLWDIIEKRKEEDEQERDTLMCDGWLENHTAILINHHTMLMQVELNRFQETLYTLRVYYWSMHRQVPLKKLSKFFDLPPMENPGIKDQAESRRDSVDRSMQSQMNNEDDKKMNLCPDSKRVDISEIAKQDEAETVKLLDEKLISDYKEALKAIHELVSSEVQQRETEEQEKLQEKEEQKQTKNASANKSKNKKQSSNKQKAPVDDPEKTPTQINKVEADNQATGGKIHKEYAAALKHAEKAAMVRIELVKDHGLMMAHSLQSRTQETLSNMEKWLQARYQAEKESVDQLSEVVCHCIEAGAKLQYELMLDCSDFHLNGDCHFVASVAPLPPPSSLEKPVQSMPTITELESLHRQLYSIAPSGFLFSSEFLDLLEDMVSVNMGRNSLLIFSQVFFFPVVCRPLLLSSRAGLCEHAAILCS